MLGPTGMREELSAVGDPIHVRALAGLLAVVVCKDLLAVDVTRAFVLEPGHFQLAWLEDLPRLQPTAAAQWVCTALVGIGFGAALGMLHASHLAARLLCALYGAVLLFDALSYTSNLYCLWLLLAICGAARLHAPSVIWPRRLGQITVSAVYIGAAVAKLDSHFLSGHTLEEVLYHDYGNYPSWFGVRDPLLFRGLAALTVLSEFSLAGMLWHPRWWRWAIALGVAFHVAIALLIPARIFSHVMIATYVLFVPEPVLQRARAALGRQLRPALRSPACLGAALVLALLDPFAQVNVLRLGAAAVALVVCMLLQRVWLLRARREGTGGKHAEPPQPSRALRALGPWIVASYLVFQASAIVKPWLGFSKFCSWRMFSEVLMMQVNTEVLQSGRWRRAVFPDAQHKWSSDALTHQWTSLSEERFYLQGYRRWLAREFSLQRRVRLDVTYSLFREPVQRLIVGPE